MVKLLIMGCGNVNPVNIFTGMLLEYGSFDYRIDGLNLLAKGTNGVIKDYENLDCVYTIHRDTTLENISSRLWRKYAFEDYTPLAFIKKLFNARFSPLKVKKILDATVIEKDYLNRIMHQIQQYDIIHIHFLEEWQSEIIPHITGHIRVVITFWGSDLMARAGKHLYNLQYDALQRADAITVIGPEMEEIVLSKFGRELKTKIHYAITGKNKRLADLIVNRDVSLLRTGKKLIQDRGKNLDDFPFVVELGYNAFEAQNHLPVIRELGKLTYKLREKVLFVVPLTYGQPDNKYIKQIKFEIEKYGLHAVFLEEYLSDTESKSISVITNIMLNLRQSDALNGSMTDSLLAGSVVFNGAWLPYKILKEKGIWFLDVHHIDNLAFLFETVIMDFNMYKKKAEKNAEILSGFLSGEANIVAWEKTYGLL